MILFIVVSLVVLLVLLLSSSRFRVSPRDPLPALLQVITPRSSSWPRKYITSLAKSNNNFQLPLKFVIQDILAGVIELRSPNETLQRILSANGQLQINTWRLLLSYGMLWPVIIYRSCLWTIFPGTYLPPRLVPIPDSQGPMILAPKIIAQPPSSTVSMTLKHSGADDQQSITKAISVLPVLLPTFASHTLRKLAVAATLDTTPRAHLDKALLALQSSIPADHLALLEFTTCESISSIWSTAWLLSVLPFMHPTVTVHRSNICQRLISVPPLRNGLPTVITLLKSGTHPCAVLSIQNVSALQAQLLDDYACNLEKGTGRQRFLAGFSDRDLALRAWRGEVFWARWEAACYTCGNITRWVICLKRPMSARHNE